MAVAAATRSLRRAERLTELEGLWEASNSDFVVADIETTGLDATVCEILEIAALLVNPAGVVLREFNVLVRAREEIPPFIVELTGISQILIDEHGVSEETAVLEFASFIGRMPIFFHNATFDTAFLAPALARHGLVFNNKVFDTLATARAAWPDLRSYKLATLAKIIDNAAVPTHRALADASATLSVLLAARELAGFGASSIEPGVMRDDLSLIANQGQLDNERV
ncbi:3'-5' exonuclease [Massilia sp. CCM 8693]|uniref:3'-5' exonuclease n=2 Tax=Massilia aquatica TaxID=2609000 RepID=A0ABX0MI74_9BURK|nr:3'-5' exonuclease [Massilia aquatica]